MSRRRLLVALAVAAGALLGPAAGHGAGGAASPIRLGVAGPDPAAFDQLTGHRHSLHLLFSFPSEEGLAEDGAAGRTPVLTLSPSGHSSAAIATGLDDAELIRDSLLANGFGQDAWIRPMPEMNGHWSPWCAVDAAGRSRGADYSGPAFARAFRRIAIVMRGGTITAINHRLQAAGLPTLRAAGIAVIQPSGHVRMLWNPQGQGSPNVAGNAPKDYWPGASYVDLVGNDLYEIRGKAWWPGMDDLYSGFGNKPFVLAEWAPWGYDSPTFVHQVFAWALSHPRTVGLIYFNRGWSGGTGTFALSTKPKALAAYRAAAHGPHFG